MQKLNGQQIIDGFHRYVDDDTELSPAEDLALLQKKYNELANDRGWEWTRKNLTDTLTTSDTYVDLPEGFRFPVDDREYDMGYVFHIGTNVYPIYPYDQRFTHAGHAYLDLAGLKLYLPTSHFEGAFNMDYYGQPEDIGLADYPAFRGGFHPVLYHMMAIDFEILERSEKARSYREENEKAVANYMEDMAFEDAEQKEWSYAK